MFKIENCRRLFVFPLNVRMIYIPIRIGKILSIVGIIFSLLTFLSCQQNKTPLSLTQPQLTLSAEYVAVTETWLQVQSENMADRRQLKVWRDTTIVFNGELATTDTTVYDSALLPAHDYTYHAAIVKNGSNLVESPPLKITTMDTTSHDFQWEVFTFGNGGSSYLNDVAIIAPDDIWCVGKINASGGPYNAVHWDGQQWELMRIPYIYNGQPYYHPLNFAFSFENGEVWFGGNGIVKWNGNNFSNVEVDQNAWGPVAINKMWGSSPNNVFIVGNEGSIARYYNGSRWQKIESWTDLPINDIWGATDYETGENYVLCPASYKFQLDEKKLLRINPDLSVEEENWPFQDRRIHSVWFKNRYHIFICGAGVFLRNRTGQYTEFNEIPLIFTERIRGTDINDLFVAGDFGILAHYNGLDWKVFPDAAFGLYRSLDYKGDIAVAVGEEAGQGVILIIKR